MSTSAKPGWLIPTGLIALAAIPVLAGSLRMAELAGSEAVLPDGARIGSAPVPIVLHIVSVIVYSVLGAFQFAPGLRRRRIGWHRAAGRVLVLTGLAVALTGLWLTLFLPRAAADGDALAAIRVLVSAGMIMSIVLAFAAIRRRDIARHRAWMIRAYALAMGAGTQAVTQVPLVALTGPLDEAHDTNSKTVLMAAAWLINIVVAEWIIRRRNRPPLQPRVVTTLTVPAPAAPAPAA